MKAAFKGVISLIVVFLIYQAIIPKFHFKYYYSSNKLQTVTQVTYPNNWLVLSDSYFTPGYYTKHEIPDVYIKPKFSFERGGAWWLATVTFHSKGIAITSYAETKNTTEFFLYLPNSGLYPDFMRVDSLRKTWKAVQHIDLNNED